MSSTIKSILKTVPSDRAHYPATNQAHYCWHKYNEFVLCLRKEGGDEDACKATRQAALSLCPEEWIETWDTQRSNGNFLGVQEKEIEKPAHGHH